MILSPTGNGRALERTGLSKLIERTSGRPEVKVAVIDGAVDRGHPAFANARIQEIGEARGAASAHGTFVAGLLREICPGCTLLIRPVIGADAGELASAVTECVSAGARVLNLSVQMTGWAPQAARKLREALDSAVGRGAVVVAAAGNQGTLAGSPITSHPGLIPVSACDGEGRLLGSSNLGLSSGRRGLCAPGDGVYGLAPGGKTTRMRGTSAATPFVSAAAALLWSEFPEAEAGEIRQALLGGGRRTTVNPPMLDTYAAWLSLKSTSGRQHAKV